MTDRDMARDGANEMLDILVDGVLTFGRARRLRPGPSSAAVPVRCAWVGGTRLSPAQHQP